MGPCGCAKVGCTLSTADDRWENRASRLTWKVTEDEAKCASLVGTSGSASSQDQGQPGLVCYHQRQLGSVKKFMAVLVW
jgi:hypothetical protein